MVTGSKVFLSILLLTKKRAKSYNIIKIFVFVIITEMDQNPMIT